jgi:hypothetical protein
MSDEIEIDIYSIDAGGLEGNVVFRSVAIHEWPIWPYSI